MQCLWNSICTEIKSVDLKAAIHAMVAFFADCGKGMVEDGIKAGSDFQ